MNIPQLLRYDVAPGVSAFSTTRHGGVSKNNYGALNVNAYCGDSIPNISTNRLLLCRELNIAPEALVVPHQVHGTEVRHIGKEFLSLPENVRRMIVEGVDAVMTNVPGLCVGVSTADCIPVLLYDAAHHAVCAIHAGWRGTAARIVQKAIAGMAMSFNSSAADLKAVIGPGISLKNFEVGQEVYNAFAEAGFDMEYIAKMYDKWHIDLWQANRMLLTQAGVKSENIQLSGICTFDNVDDYFSARRLGINSGRIYSGIILRQ